FKEDLLPLLESVHGDTRHVGKVPRRLPRAKGAQLELAQLRRKLQQAVTEEAYEEAARIRDRIKELEEGRPPHGGAYESASGLEDPTRTQTARSRTVRGRGGLGPY